MNFREFLIASENVNNRPVNPSGGAGIATQKPATPQKQGVAPTKNLKKKGGAFGGGSERIKPNEVPPSPYVVTSKDQPSDLKKFMQRPPSPFSSFPFNPLFPQLKPFKPEPGKHLPGVKYHDPTKVKQTTSPKMPEG